MRHHPAKRVRVKAPHNVLPLDDALRLGIALMHDRRLADAQNVFEQVRVSAPDHPTALTMLSSIAYQQGSEPLGAAYHNRAIDTLLAAQQALPSDQGTLAPLVNLLLARHDARDDQGDRRQAEQLSHHLALGFNPIRATHEQFSARLAAARRRGLPTILLATLPKTASETIWNRLAAGLAMPQTHLALGLFPQCCLLPQRMQASEQGGLIAKEHIAPTPHNLACLQQAGLDRIVVHVRDPRQIALSWSHFLADDVAHRMLAPLWRQTMPKRATIDAGIGAIIDWSIDHYLPLIIDYLEAWRRAETDHGLKIVWSEFEQFRQSPDTALDAILEGLGLDQMAFDWAAARRADDVHLRVGEHDEWRRVFTAEQQRRAGSMIPNSLLQRFCWDV